MSKKKTGSIDDITPEEWNEMNRKHLDELANSGTITVTQTPSLNYEDFEVSTVDINLEDVTYDLWDTYNVSNDYNVSFGLTDNTKQIDYKFREDELINEVKNYIDSTYTAHYCQSGIQSSEVIVDRGRGIGFFLGNVDKYNARYGNKGTKDDHRKDLLKIIHYALLALYVHDRENS
jgi:hypothetical protein